MKREELLDAIGKLDEDLIVEAAQTPTRRRPPLWQVATAAAAAVAVCMGVYLWPAMQPAGKTAPMAPQADNAGCDILTDGQGECRTEQSKASASTAVKDQETAGETQGIFEPIFVTEQGVYLLTAIDFKQKLPEDVRYLGELADAKAGAQSYPSVRGEELVGCPVWESADGEYLYIQMPEGDWWTARQRD